MPDYEAACASFSCEAARHGLAGLPGGRGLNMAHAAVDRHRQEGRGGHLALRRLGRHGEREVFTYAELRAWTNRFAQVLAGLGIAPGEHVFSLLGRVPELYFTALGTLKHRAVFCPLFSAFGPEPIRARLRRASDTYEIGPPKGALHVHGAVLAHHVTGSLALELHPDGLRRRARVLPRILVDAHQPAGPNLHPHACAVTARGKAGPHSASLKSRNSRRPDCPDLRFSRTVQPERYFLDGETSMARDMGRFLRGGALLCGWLMGVGCGGQDTGGVPAVEPLGTQEAAMCAGTSVSSLSLAGISTYEGEMAGNGQWAVASPANAVRLEYYLDNVLQSSEERPYASGTWYFSTAGVACGSHGFLVKAIPMVIDSAGNRTVCWSSPGRTLTQTVADGCPSATVGNSYNWNWGNVSNVRFGGGDNVAVVTAGATVSVSTNYFIDAGSVGCPGCISQVILGVSGSKKCLYSGVGVVSSSATTTLTAPTAPGSYLVWARGQWEYNCTDALNKTSSGGPVGLIEVYANPYTWNWGSISNLTVNGKTNKRVRAAPGASLALTENFSLNTGSFGCPTCIAQIVMGLEGGSKQCIYSGSGVTSGSAAYSLTAPTIKGVYKLWANRELQFSCANALNLLNDGAAVSFVEVDTCAHDKCSTGGPLTSGCDQMCVKDICGVDPYCCQTSWDSVCVGRVASICKQQC
ncbi:MAG TPA: AMP-binding protein [Archangium sp.]|uniref:AMP-binding protein n=1 Tax=Archangium sp. TaxID=1872627 RepID=UPI002E30E096|nr:AMP-binding protein [Archangium sp.]HEX5744870.1 AMP-binding protein [Archangium sp.]